MGNLEKLGRQTLRKTRVQEALLRTLLSNGRMGSAELVTSAIEVFFDIDVPLNSRKTEVMRSAASRLKRKGLVKFQSGHYALTGAGEKVLAEWDLADYRIARPKQWDGRWRVVIFDIPERFRAKRKELNSILTLAGFQRLQDSVWVHAFDCEDVIGLLKTRLGLGRFMLYMLVDQLENDRYLRMDFDLLK